MARACKWGDGDLFATASDPFTSRDLGVINVFRSPVEGETELERKLMIMFAHYYYFIYSYN